MRKLLAFFSLSVLISLLNTSTAQTTDSTKFLFEKLPNSLFPSGLFHPQSALKYMLEDTDADLHRFDGSIGGPLTTTALVEELYVDLYQSQRLASNGRIFGTQQPYLVPVEDFYNASDAANNRVDVPLFLNWFKLQDLKQDALSQGLFDFSGGQFKLIPEYEYLDPQRQFFIHNKNPLDSARKGIETFTTFFAGTVASAIYASNGSASVTFELPSALVQSNQTLPATFDIDFGDGKGFRSVALNKKITVQYTSSATAVEAQAFKIRVRAKTATGVLESSLELQVVFNVELAHLEFSTQTLPAPSCYETFEPTEPAKVSVRYADENLGMQKPLILVEGFESSNKNYGVISYEGLSSGYIYKGDQRVFLGMEKLAWLYDSLSQEGFDIIHVDFKDSRLSIRENMQSVIKTISWVNDQNPQHPMVVVGASMGGLISRAALLEIERKGCCFNIAAFGTFDTPHRGAFIPVGMQAAAKRMGDMFWMLPSKQSYDNAINSDAAREMLIEHFDHSASTDRFRLQQLLNDEQPNVRRFAICNGSDLGDVAPIQDAQKRLLSWGKSRIVTYKHHVGNHQDTLTYNETGRTKTIKAIGADAEAHQSGSNYLYLGNKRQLPFTFARIGWVSSLGSFKAKQAVKWGNILGMSSSKIDAGVVKVQQYTNQRLTKLIGNATKQGLVVKKIGYSKKYAELPGSYTETGAAFETFFIDVFSPNHTFVPSYSALDLPDTYRTSVLRSKMDEIPFHSYYAPGVISDGASGNTEHIYTDQEVIDYCMSTLRSIEQTIPGAGGTLAKSFNIAKTRDQSAPYISSLSNLTIQPQATLGIGLSQDIGYAGSRVQADNAQNIEVFLGAQCAPAVVEVEGTLEIGGDQGIALLRVRSGSTLRISKGATLRLNPRAQLIVEKDAQLIFEPGSAVFWDEATITSRGQFQIAGGATFRPQGAGTLRLEEGNSFRAPQGGLIALKSATLALTSGVALPFTLQKLQLVDAKVIYANNATLRCNPPLEAVRSSFTMQGSKQWPGLIAVGQAALDSCVFSGGAPSLTSKTQQTSIERSYFYNAEVGYQAKTPPVLFDRNEFSACTTGAIIQGSGTRVQNCAFTSCESGLELQSQKGTGFVERTVFSRNTTQGLLSTGVDLRLECSRFENNASGILISGAGINLANNAGCTFTSNVIGIEATSLDHLHLNNGHNVFSGNSLTDIKASLSPYANVAYNGSYFYFLANFNSFSANQSTQIYTGRDRVYMVKTNNGSPSSLVCPSSGTAKMQPEGADLNQEQAFSVFPNPSNSPIGTARFEALSEPGTLQVANMNGQILFQQELQPGDYQVHFTVPESAGTFIVRLTTNSYTMTERWIVTP